MPRGKMNRHLCSIALISVLIIYVLYIYRCDVREYQASERENRRKSVALRLDSWREQKLATEKLRNQQILQQEEDAYFKELEAEDLRNAKEAMKNAEKMDILLGKFAF